MSLLTTLESTIVGEVVDVPAAIIKGLSAIVIDLPIEELNAFKDAAEVAIKDLQSGSTFGAAYADALTALYNDEKLIVKDTTVKLLEAFVTGASSATPATE